MKNIALVLNSKYVKETLVFLNSLFLNNTNDRFKIFVINSQLKDEEVKKLKMICTKHNNELINVKVDNNLFNTAPILWKTHAKEAYYKLLLPEILPDDVKKILYFDIDIIINGSIDDLYNINIGNYYLAAVPDYFVNKYDKEYVKSLGINEGEYFNSGVVLFNLELIRKSYKFSDAEKYIEENGSKFHYHDQEVLNALFKEKVLFLDEKYNNIAKFKGIMDFVNYILKRDKDIRVVHYAGVKPWDSLYYGKSYKEFWKYVENDMGLDKNEHENMRRKKYLIVIFKTIRHVVGSTIKKLWN